MSYSYASISRFGQPSGSPNLNDPLTYCLTDSMDKNFQHGVIGVTSGPRSKRCQSYMAERCATNWDGFCEYFYQEHRNPSKQWPNNRSWPDTLVPKFWTGQTSSLTIGDQLLKNSAETKYCTYPSCYPRTELFNPLDPNSPRITYWVPRDDSGGGCIPVCRVDPTTVDDDVLMDKMLSNPVASKDTIINICNTARREGVDLSGTKIGGVCKRYFENIGK